MPTNEELNNSRRFNHRAFLFGKDNAQIIEAPYNAFVQHKSKTRKLTKNEEEKYKLCFNAVLTDLYSCWMTDPTCYLGYSRSKVHFERNGSYWNLQKNCSFFSQNILLNTIDFLSNEEWIENHIQNAGYKTTSSRMRATKKLIDYLNEEQIKWPLIGQVRTGGNIIVKDVTKGRKIVVPFPNDPEFDLEACRVNLERINQNLFYSKLNLNISDLEYERLFNHITYGEGHTSPANKINTKKPLEPFEFTNRSLRRIFSKGSFRFGGRFYGGWWQGIPSKYRKFIEIDGAVTAEYDYSTMQAMIVYAKAGCIPPEDCYSPKGSDNKVLRKIRKKAFNQLLNSKPQSRSPENWKGFAPDVPNNSLPSEYHSLPRHKKIETRRDIFERSFGVSYDQVLHELYEYNTDIQDYFFTEAWSWVQNIDSRIAEMAMIKLLDQGVTVLPIHDSFIVRRSQEGDLKEAMMNSFKEVVGTECKIERDRVVYEINVTDDNASPWVTLSSQSEATKEWIQTHQRYRTIEYDWHDAWGA